MNYSSGTPWEAAVGYSRAVRIGSFVYVAGTVAADEQGRIIAPEDGYQQAVYALNKIKTALERAGANLEDVVRTRMFVTDLVLADAVGRAHQEFFGEIRPASTMVEVARLAGEGSVVEIEADAVVSD